TGTRTWERPRDASIAICTLAGYTASTVSSMSQPPARRVRGIASSAPDAISATPETITASRRHGNQRGTIRRNGPGTRKWAMPMPAIMAAARSRARSRAGSASGSRMRSRGPGRSSLTASSMSPRADRSTLGRPGQESADQRDVDEALEERVPQRHLGEVTRIGVDQRAGLPLGLELLVELAQRPDLVVGVEHVDHPPQQAIDPGVLDVVVEQTGERGEVERQTSHAPL